jgi:murein DD-endopeptidase MepM/ murein hydrolase activator NlpD
MHREIMITVRRRNTVIKNARPRALLLAALLLAGCNASGRPEPGSPGYVAPRPVAAAPAAPLSPGPGGQIYNVIPGDSVYGVAERFGVPVRTLIESNGLSPPYRLQTGQQLRVPARREHVVERGETLFGIARIYGVDQSSLARLNKLAPPYSLRPGARLNLPGQVEAQMASATAADAPAEPTVSSNGGDGAMTVEELPPTNSAGSAAPTRPSAPPSAEQGASAKTGTGTAAPTAPAAKPAPPPAQSSREQTAVLSEPAPRDSGKFLWPVQGKILSSFGAKTGGLHNDGINIAAPPGTDVVAAENGVVAYAGNELRGFGNLLLLRHADGWITAYAHNDQLLVKRGDTVKRGQPIAKLGRTGNVSTPQLHFELRRGSDPVDPRKYLGPQGAAVSPAAAPDAPPNPG